MKKTSVRRRRDLINLVALSGAAVPLMYANAASTKTVVVKQLDPNGTATSTVTKVPGLPADQSVTPRDWAGTAFWGVDTGSGQATTPSFRVPAIDNAGDVAFYGTIGLVSGVINNGSLAVRSNQDAIFFATPSNNYDFTGKTNVIAVRDGSPTLAAPQEGGPTPTGTGLPSDATLNNPVNGRAGITNGLSLSSNGTLAGTGIMMGTGLTAGSNNNVVFTGTNTGGTTVVARRGDTAPGTGGNTIAGAGSGANLNFSGQSIGGLTGGNTISNSIINNPSGQVAIGIALATGTGPVISTSGGTQNDTGLFVAGPSGIDKVYRRNEFVSGSSGVVFGAPMGTNSRAINASGDVLFGNLLSTNTTLAGATTATSTTNQAYFLYSGGTNTMIARAGATVGGSSGIAGSTFLAASNTIPAISQQSLNNGKRVLFDASLTPGTGPVVATADSEALLTWTPANGVAPIFRTASDAVPGVPGATFSTFKPNLAANASRLNNLDHAVISAVMTIDGVNATAANNQGLWYTTDVSNAGSNTSLIARSGMDVSAAFGLSTGSLVLGTANMLNIVLAGNSDIVVFQDVLSDSRLATFGWTPATGLIGIGLAQPNTTGPAGDTDILGANYALTGLTYNCASNGDGGVQSLNDNGFFTYLAMSGTAGGTPTPNNSAIVVFQVPAPGAAGVLAMSGLLVTGSRRRR